MRRAVRSGALAALVALAGPAALSADAHADAESDVREAKERFEEGIARARGGDWDGARRSFQQSVAISPTQTAMFNLALAEEKCARAAEAVGTFKAYSRRYALSDDERAQARRHIADLMAQTGHIDVRAPSGTLLTLDTSQDAGTTPLPEPLDVEPGHHVVAAKLPHGSKSLAVDVSAGQTVRLVFEGAAEERAVVTVGDRGAAGGDRSGGGGDRGAAGGGADGDHGPAGGDRTAATAGGVSAPQPEVPEPLSAPAQPPPRMEGSGSWSAGRTALLVGLAVGALAAVGGGVGLEIAGDDSQRRADQLHPQLPKPMGCEGAESNSGICQQLLDANSSRANDRNFAAGFFVAGGVLAAGAVVALAWPQSGGPKDTRVFFVPTLAGMSLVGEF